MALLNTKDLSTAHRALETWLAARLPDGADVELAELSSPGSSGFSADTLFIAAEWNEGEERREHRLVARVAPTGAQLFPDYDLDQQFRLLEALHAQTDVPVPTVRWLEPSSSVLGAPFFVMDQVDGRVPVDSPNYLAEGWVLDLSAEERRRMFEAGIEVLAKVHAVDWRACGLGELGRPELGSTPLDQQLRYFEEYYGWARLDDRPHPIIDQAFAWVREHLPTDEPDTVLNWGDARPGNLIFAHDLSVAAVLDWELAVLGSRELDLGWWIFTQQAFSEGYGLSLAEGIPDAAETVERYSSIAGYTPQDLDFHVRFAGLRSSLMMVRYCTVMSQAGAIPPDTAMMHDNPIVQTLAKVMGLDWGVGDVTALQLNRQTS